MAVTVYKPEEQNISQAPTLGQGSGTFGANAQQRKNIAQGGSGRFTNLQQYVQANEANNPNAQLLQREATARQGELGTRQQEFVKQAEPIKSGFESIRSGQQFVQSALENPTQIVQTPSNIQRFAGYRTQGIGDIETPFNQLQTARGTLGTQQEQLATGLETIQRDPNALQNYLQSQRANPSLATRGENVLDRFLTQSTESGQRAIAGLGTTAGVIRSSQAPGIVGEIETLRTQAQGKPLSSADVGNLLTGKITPEQEFVRNINKNYVASQSGIGQTESDIQSAKSQYDNSNSLDTSLMNAQLLKNVYENINNNPIFKSNLELQVKSTLSSNNRKPSQNQIDNEVNRIAREKTAELNNQINTIQNSRSSINRDIVSKYANYLGNINKTKQQLLQQYDPTRLSRIQALQQLAGTNQFNSLLTGGIQ